MQEVNYKLSELHITVDNLIRKLNELRIDNEKLKTENDSFREEIKGLKKNILNKDFIHDKQAKELDLHWKEEIADCIEDIDRCIAIIEKQNEI